MLRAASVTKCRADSALRLLATEIGEWNGLAEINSLHDYGFFKAALAEWPAGPGRTRRCSSFAQEVLVYFAAKGIAPLIDLAPNHEP